MVALSKAFGLCFLLMLMFGSVVRADDLIFEGPKPKWIPKTDEQAKAERENANPADPNFESLSNRQKPKSVIKDPFAGIKWTPVDPSLLKWGDESESSSEKQPERVPDKQPLSSTSLIQAKPAAAGEKKSIDDLFGELAYKAQSGDTVNFKEVTFSTRSSTKIDPGSDEGKAAALDKEAQALSKDLKFKEAHDLMDKAVKLDPYSGEQLYNRGLLAQRINKAADSIKDFELAQKLTPAIAPKCKLEIARSSVLTGDKSRAKEVLWGLRNQSGLNRDTERAVDSLLVRCGDEKSLSNSMMISNAADGDLRQALSDAVKGNRLDVVPGLCRALEGRSRTVKNLNSVAYGLSKIKRYTEALHFYRQAHEMDKSDTAAVIGVVKCATETGQTDEVQAVELAYLAHNPNGLLASTFREQVSYYEKDFAKTKSREMKAPRSADSPHFSKTCMPLKVYVPDFDSATSSWKGNIDRAINYMDTVQRAFNAWNAASNGIVSFQMVPNIDDAHISVEWVGASSGMVHSFAAGVTGVTANSKGGFRHYVKLLVPRASSSSNEQQFYETTLHEFGHALGLSHSSSPQDIMYFAEVNSADRRDLSENDVSRIQQLYKY